MNHMSSIRRDDAITTAQDTIRRLEELVPVFRERGATADAERRLADETIHDLEAAGVFRAMRPAGGGGLECTLREFAEITRIAARGDASVGWVVGLLTAHAWQLSMLGREAQDRIFADNPSALAVEVVSANGTAVMVDGGFEVTGRWAFASGSLHAQWAIVVAFCEGIPIGCVVPMDQLTVHDTWKVGGMRATGSNDIEARDIFVPSAMTIPMSVFTGFECPAAEFYDYPLLRYPTARILPLIHSAVALGVADAAIDLYRTSIKGRVRIADKVPVGDLPATHELFAEAAHEHRCAELLMHDAIDILDAAFGEGGPASLTLDQRARLNLANAGSAHLGFKAIDIIMQGAGASIHRSGHPMDRICRDTQVMRNHTIVDWRHHKAVCGNVLLGNELNVSDFQF